MKSRRILIALIAATLTAPLAYGVVSGQVSADEAGKRESDTTAEIAIDAKNFPDEEFRSLVTTTDLDANGYLSDAERKSVNWLSCEEGNVRSCEGIEFFPNLEQFNCAGNKIKEMDLSKNLNLVNLSCSNNQLTNLDLSHNVKLETLSCSQNKIQTLDCSKLTNLMSLDCVGEYEETDGKIKLKGYLTSLNVTGCEKLEYISVAGNKLKQLDVSTCTNLKDLFCLYNQLDALDLSHQTQLEQLGCGSNNLTSLDVSHARNLSYLEFACAKIGSIDLSKNRALTELHCEYNELTSLDLSGLFHLTTAVTNNNHLETLDIGDTKLVERFDPSMLEDKGSYYEFDFEEETEEEFITYCLTFDKTTKLESEPSNDIVCKIDAATFPDAAFRRFIATTYDLNGDKKLSTREVGKVEEMSLDADAGDHSEAAKSIKGIENFFNLKHIHVWQTQLEEFAPAKMESLESFAYFGVEEESSQNSGKLKKLDLSRCGNIQSIEVRNCRISSLDISKNPLLTHLELHYLPIKNLKLNNNPRLDFVFILGCDKLASLELGGNDALEYLSFTETSISKLDLSQCPNLTTLDCYASPISNLDLRPCQNLRALSCSTLPARNIDFNAAANLYDLFLLEMNITKLDLSKLSKLTNLYVSKTKLGKLDLSHNPDIVTLTATDCELESLNISKLSGLKQLEVQNNKLSKLDLSNCDGLVEFDCSNNSIQSLDLSNKLGLQTIKCTSNDLKSLDLSICFQLISVNCSCNADLSDLKLPPSNQLLSVHCADCNLTKLDVDEYALTELSCGGNPIADLNIDNQVFLYLLDLHSMNLGELNLKRMENLTELDLHDNLLSKLVLNKDAQLYSIDLRYNLFAKDPKFDAVQYSFEPQKYVAQPQNFHLVSKDQKSISLAWDKAEHAERYEIYRSTTKDGEYTTVGSVTECAFKDTNIDPAQTYYYYVIGFRSLEEYEPGLGEWGGAPSEILVVGEAGDPTPTPSDDATFEEFVERLYTVALNRKSDAEGKKFWIKQVVEEGKTGADCARFFLLDAPEFMQRNLSVEDFVETLYATFFDRESDEGGKKGWVEAIKTGAKTRAEVVNDFIESTEWCNVCAAYGVKSGAQWHKATKASKNATNFATRLYTCCLKRDAEQGGLEYWSLALTNLEKTGAQAAQFFFESEEFVGYNTTLNDYLNRLYTTFMDRQPAASEIEYWVGEVKAGRQNRHSILAFFAQSPEFSEICKKYGIDRGEIG